jgi:hypothetical protein
MPVISKIIPILVSSNYTYHWTPTSWTPCSVSCGTGKRSRSLFCSRDDDSTVSNDFCASEEKISEVESCKLKTCVHYSWGKGPWSECAADCGLGAQRRKVACLRKGSTKIFN